MKKHYVTGAIALFTLIFGAQAQVSPLALGRASNAFTFLRQQQNQVYANDSLNIVAFIHRQDVTIWGGGGAANGRLRYDVSNNGGASFVNDIGILNNTYTIPARFPQLTLHNPVANTNPLNQDFVWTAPTFSSVINNWDGMVSGTADFTTSIPVSSTETYDFQGQNTDIPGGLTEGLPGEYWMSELRFVNNLADDSLRIRKGVYNAVTDDVEWSAHTSIFMNHNTVPTGDPMVEGPNLAFSPDGNDGWAAMLGDIVGGANGTTNPIFFHSSNGGATWGNAIEVNLANAAYEGDTTSLAAELLAFWTDAGGNPSGTGIPTCGFDFDLTVDADGNPHMFVVVGNAANDPYSIFSGFIKIAADVYSEDDGVTWKIKKIAPVYTFRGMFGTPDGAGNLLIIDNAMQISRTADGEYLFYSWADSDTADIGFGVFTNDAPNLRIAGQRLSDGYLSCPKWITLGDAVWDGQILTPSMAPEVLTDGSNYKLPIVSMNLISNDQLAPTSFWYFGNDAIINEAEFVAPATLLNTDACEITCSGPPVAGFSTSSSNLTAVFTDLSTSQLAINSWTWDFGNGNSSSLQNPTHTFTSPGAYNVCLTAEGSCGSNTTCQTVTVTCPGPGAAFTQTSNFLTTSFTDVSTTGNTITSWSWNFGDGNSSTLQNPTHTFAGSGTYNVCLTVTDGCSSTITCQNITVTACTAPGASFSSNANGLSLSFTDQSTTASSITAWSWDFGDGNSSTLQNPSHSFAASGTYNVCLTVTDNCNSSTSCQSLTVTCTGPTAQFTESANALTVNFTDASTTSGTITNWSWDFGNGNLSTLQSPQHTFTSAGTYNVCLTVTDGCSSNTSCQMITVTNCSGPTAQFTESANALTVNFSDASTTSSTITSWNWDFGNGNSSTLQNPQHTFTSAGTYNVCLTVTDGCSSNTTCQMITVNTCTPPTPQFTESTTALVVSFSDASTTAGTISAWSWDFGDGNSSTLQNPTHTYAAAGTFNVCLTVTDGCASETTCRMITTTVCTGPTAAFTETTNMLSVEFTDASTSPGTITAWNWDFGDGSSSALQNPQHVYTASGMYQACLTVTDGCTTDSTCMQLNLVIDGIEENQFLSEASLYPNPTNGWITVDLATTAPQNLVLEVVDLTGKLIYEAYEPAAMTNLVLDLSAAESGLYYLILTSSEDQRKTLPIAVAH